MDYGKLRIRFGDLYKKHAHTSVEDTSWLGRGLSPEEIINAEKEIIRTGSEIINAERMSKYVLPEDIKLISAEISSFSYETPYFMGDSSPEKKYPSLSDLIQENDLEIQTVSSILDWGGDDFGFLWEAELQLANDFVNNLSNIFQIGEIGFSNLIGKEIIPIGFSNCGTLYINLYGRNKNIGSVVHLIANEVLIIQTLSNSYESFISNMLSSLERVV